jgi:hypothetical protein
MADAEANSHRAEASGGDIKLGRTAEQRERHHSRGVGGARQEEREAEGVVLALLEHSHGGARPVEGQRQLEVDCRKRKDERSTEIMPSQQCTNEYVKQMKHRRTVRYTHAVGVESGREGLSLTTRASSV